MKSIILSACVMTAMSSFAFAGGDIAPVMEPVIPEEPVFEALSGFYAGLGLSAVSTRDSVVSLDFLDEKTGQDRLGNISLSAGYNFNEYIAIEGRYMTTISEEDRIEMDGWSLFAKPQYPVGEKFSVYALFGFGGVTMDGVNGYNVDVDEIDFQWGVGLNYLAAKHISVFVDYTSLAKDMDGIYWNGAPKADADGITVGVNYLF